MFQQEPSTQVQRNYNFALVTLYGGGYTVRYSANFGQKPFKFPPPAGFQPLNAANVRPETVITRPDQYVGATFILEMSGTQKYKCWSKTRFSVV